MNLDFNQICRLCFKYCENFVDLRDVNGVKNLASDVIEKIQFCYCFKIDPAEPLPTKICHQCIQVLMLFYVTKKNLGVSEQFLQNILNARSSQESNLSGAEVNNINNTKPKEVSVLLHKISVPNTVQLNQNSKDKLMNVKHTKGIRKDCFVVDNKNVISDCGSANIRNNVKKLDIAEKNTVQSTTDSPVVQKKKDLMVRLKDIQDLEVKLEGNEANCVGKKSTNAYKLIKSHIDESNILSPEAKKARKARKV